jgi:serine/threonine protein kinase
MIEGDPPTIGRYEILAALGQGGMAHVYLGALRDAGAAPRLVVIKQIRPELASQPELRRMFFDEARIGGRLHHPNVVATHGLIHEAGQVSLVMEYLEGRTLAEVLNRIGRPQFPLEESLWILCEVLAGLQHGHELRAHDGSPGGVVHQDVSPSNVFVTYDGEVKLLDFGIAKAAGTMAATRKGSSKGKLAYAAPERLLFKEVDARADVFSVGMMLWEATAGRRRSTGENQGSTRAARLAGLETRIRDVRPDVPPELAEIIECATEVDPRARFRTAAELRERLKRYLATRPRQVGQREVAALLWVHFKADRVQMRARIEELLAGMMPAPGPEEARSRSPLASMFSSSPVLHTLRLQPSRTTVAAAVIAAAGIAGMVVGLVRGPSRTEVARPSIAGAPVHSVVLDDPVPMRPPRSRFIAVSAPPPAAMHATPRPVPLPLAEKPARPRPLVVRPRVAERMVSEEKAEPPRPEPRRPVEPGMDLDSPGRAVPHRQLDEKDPYSP